MRRVLLISLALSSSAAYAQQNETANAPIIVSGNREIQAETNADMAKSITLRPPANKPLPRHYEPICVKLFGIDKDYADVVLERINANILTLKLRLGGKKCQPNAWVGFVEDSHASVARLRKEEPTLFGELHPYEIDQILSGAKAAQAWHALEDKGVDGKPF